jgi:Glycosyl hydrolases family 28
MKTVLLSLVLSLCAFGQGRYNSGSVLWASAIPGVILDASLNGSGTQTCTDNAAKLNAAVAAVLASFTSATLFLDGPSCIGATTTLTNQIICLAMPSAGNWSIIGVGPSAGFLVKSGANCTALSNSQNQVNQGTPATIGNNGNIILRDFTLNANWANQSGTVCATGTGTDTCFGIFLQTVNNVTVHGIALSNTYSFGILLSNVSNVWVEDNLILEPNLTNHDPIHFDGPFTNITVSGNQLQAGDDCIALNAPEGYGGNSSGVFLLDNAMVGAGCLDYVRMYNYNGSGSTFTITNVIMDGLTGLGLCNNANTAIFWFGGATTGVTEANDVKISHVDVNGNSNCQLLQTQGSWGIVDISDWRITSPRASAAVIQFGGVQTEATVSNGVIQRAVTADDTAWPVQVNGGNLHLVYNLTLSNIAVLDTYGQNFTAAPYLIDVSGSARAINLTLGGGLTSYKISAFASSGSVAQMNNVFGSIPWPLTVATLPTCAAPMAGAAFATVTDALVAPTFLVAPSGGGTNFTPVVCNNATTWVSY